MAWARSAAPARPPSCSSTAPPASTSPGSPATPPRRSHRGGSSAMSYILDALRRADAERERGVVPSLQSQQHTVVDEDDPAPRSRPLVWVIVALGVALVALLAWMLLGGGTTPRPVAERSVAPAAVAP